MTLDDSSKEKIFFVMVAFILILGLLTYPIILTADNHYCKSAGYDKYNFDEFRDKVGDKIYISCCIDRPGNDTCNWIQRGRMK